MRLAEKDGLGTRMPDGVLNKSSADVFCGRGQRAKIGGLGNGGAICAGRRLV